MAEVNGVTSEVVSADPQPPSTQNEQSPPPTTDQTNPNLPPSSHADNGLSKRPRDSRLLHMILANYGVTAYQERVPLQLMDFAYRYTSSTLQDALHFTSEGYGTSGAGSGTGRGAAHNDLSSVTLSALRLSIASRTHYQFNPTLPKEFYNEIAGEKNRVALPPVSREWGMRLPPEQYCLTGVGFDLKEDWDEVMEDVDENKGVDEVVKDEPMDDNEGEGDGDAEGGRMEDIFGEDVNGGNGEGDGNMGGE
ncbi:Transcription initiation factor TFIID subunit 9 [Mycoblastus sanguinarius]|nr:Transcription initiation factor TFIID subunit 9 [Mycoblastus sanguinarius]